MEASAKRNEYPAYLMNLKTSKRHTIGIGQNSDPEYIVEYDAYVKDIATVSIVFKKSSLVQLGSRPTMGWVDYFAAVGGLLGLVLGMGIVSFIELFWLGLRMLALKYGKTDWIA